MTTFFVPGVPAPQGSKSFKGMRGGKPILVESSKKVGPWRQVVAQVAALKLREPLDGPITLDLEFVMPRTKAMGKKPAPPMVQAPDIDKLVRSTCDALSGVAYGDDSQVVKLGALKRRAEHGEQTGAHITVNHYEHPTPPGVVKVRTETP